MSRKYKFGEKDGAYFISFATVFWIDVFTGLEYFDIMISSLDYCRKKQRHDYLWLLHYAQSIRDFKGFTSRKIIKAIEGNNQESRKQT